MRRKSFYLLLVFVSTLTVAFIYSKKANSIIKEQDITYSLDGLTFKGFVSYDESLKGTRPVVLIVHEWWGLNDYTKKRARQIAELGYLAMAVDVFGNGKNANDPHQAQDLTRPFYNDPQLAKKRLDAAVEKIKTYSQADTSNLGAMGYCFGGYVVLNAAKLGANFKGAVVFHGGLGGAPARKDLLKSKILVCYGASDKIVTEQDLNSFKHQMDSIGADYRVKIYPNATHAFSNPDATVLGKKFNLPLEYNPEADINSWNDMKAFFYKIFKR